MTDGPCSVVFDIGGVISLSTTALPTLASMLGACVGARTH
jgi:hypothetical protein